MGAGHEEGCLVLLPDISPRGCLVLPSLLTPLSSPWGRQWEQCWYSLWVLLSWP